MSQGNERMIADGRGFQKDLLVWVAIVAAVGLGAIVGSSPDDSLLFVASGCGFLLLGVCVLWRPRVLVYFIVITSALAGLLRSIDNVKVGSTAISVSGMRWGAVAALMMLFVLAHFKKLRIQRWVLGLALLPLWTFAVWIATGLRPTGVKDLLFYGSPLLAFLFCSHLFGGRDDERREWVERLILASAILPLLVYLVAIPLGAIEVTRNGPRGVIGSRAVSMFLLIPEALGLAWWRYSTRARDRARGAAVGLLSLAVILFTLSRMTGLLGITLAGCVRLNPNARLRSAAFGVITVLLAVGILVSIPQVRERTFYRFGPDTIGVLAGLNTSGRNAMWPVAFRHALEKPLTGWGPGSSRTVVGNLFADHTEYPPHNEYLQVFHDTGILGLIALLIGWLGLLRRQVRHWRLGTRLSDQLLSRSAMAACLGIGVLLVTAITDNTFHYLFVVLPVIMLVATTEARFACLQTAPALTGSSETSSPERARGRE